jgi:hypothetical protein
MPRFTSVQAYADNNANLRKLTYEQATGKSVQDAVSASASAIEKNDDSKLVGSTTTTTNGDAKSTTTTTIALVQPEKVVNPYGSAAGAGSGEFHVYRHARAREMKRWQEMEEQEHQQQLIQEFQQQQQDNQRQLEHATSKRRRKRQREKLAKQRKKNLIAAGINVLHHTIDDNNNVVATTTMIDHEDAVVKDWEFNKKVVEDEVECTHPLYPKKLKVETRMDGNFTGVATETVTEEKDMVIKNDGSFLEMMKKKLHQQQTEPNEQPKAIMTAQAYETNVYDDDDVADATLPH